MADHPLEVLLRPPVELWSGTVALSAAVTDDRRATGVLS